MNNYKLSSKHLLYLFLLVLIMTGCNIQEVESDPSKLNVTQAYQTLNAGLTQALSNAQTETPSLSDVVDNKTPVVSTTETATDEISATAVSTKKTVTPVTADDTCNQAAAANPIDITIEDGTEMEAGEAFTKIWRVKNVGTCTWSRDYQTVFFSGEIMGAASSVPLPEEVVPGGSVDLEIEMTAPLIPGTYQGNWKLSDPGGQLFGIGPGSESPFWVRIVVPGEINETPSLTQTLTLTPAVQIQASGTINLVVGDTLDLDNLVKNSSGADFIYRITVVDPRHQIMPLVVVKMSVFGIEEPGLSDCRNRVLGNFPINLEAITVGTYICYRTDLGLPGWARLDSFIPDTGDTSFTILTWKLP